MDTASRRTVHTKLILKDKHMEITRSDTVRVSSSANTVHRETQEDFSRNVLSGFPFFQKVLWLYMLL